MVVDKYAALVGKITAELDAQFRRGTKSSLDALRRLKAPDVIVEFYSDHEPVRSGRGQVRLWPIADMVVENTQAVPGVGVHPHGYVVFASTFGGDAYCFNLNKLDARGEPEIILVSHECVAEDCTADEAHQAVKKVANSLYDFLEQYSRGAVDEECVYPR